MQENIPGIKRVFYFSVCLQLGNVKFDFSTAVKPSISVFWEVALTIEAASTFETSNRLNGAGTQRVAFFKLAAVRTQTSLNHSNPKYPNLT